MAAAPVCLLRLTMLRLAILGGVSVGVVVVLWVMKSIHRRDLSRVMRDVSPFPSLTWLIAGFAVFATLIVGSAGAHAILRIPSGASQAATAPAALIGYALAISLGAWLMHVFAQGAPRAGVSARWKDLLLGLAWLAVAAAPVMLTSDVSVLAHERITGEAAETIAHPSLAELAKGGVSVSTALLIVTAVIGAPIAEEMVYRVFLQSAILRATQSAWTAIMVTSALFTVMHAATVPVYALPTLFVLSVAIGLAYERTGSAGVPMAMHVLFNGANVAIVAFA